MYLIYLITTENKYQKKIKMNHNLEIQKLLLKINSLNHPEDKMNLLKQAILIADSNNDIEWGFDLRLDLIFTEKDTSHCNDSFSAFAWLLNTRDNNPELFDESDFLWEYKWMAGSARRNSNIPLEQIHLIQEDLKERMARNGYTLRGYYSVMIFWYLSIGDIKKSKEFLILRDTAARDRMSHCQACELNTDVEIELLEGNFDSAITKANDLITKKLTCGVMPLITFCNLTYFLGKVGDKRADEYFPKAEEEINKLDKNDTSLISHISDLLLYLTLTNKNKAWEYFEEYADWEVNSEDETSFIFSKNVLPLLREKGFKNLNLSSKLPYYSTNGNYNLNTLFNYYFDKATILAEKFDKRNNTDQFNKQIKEVLALSK